MNSEIDMNPLIKWITTIDESIQFRQSALQKIPENVCIPPMEMTYDLNTNWNHFLCVAQNDVWMKKSMKDCLFGAQRILRRVFNRNIFYSPENLYIYYLFG